MTEKCIELVKHFEGFSPKVYVCPAGYFTIGYGHVIPKSQFHLWKDKILSKEEAEELLVSDLLKVEYLIKKMKLIAVDIHPYMLDALISFSFNVGVFAFERSTLRRKLNRSEFRDAADEFLKWVYAGGKKMKGLIRRRKAEKEVFLEGVKYL